MKKKTMAMLLVLCMAMGLGLAAGAESTDNGEILSIFTCDFDDENSVGLIEYTDTCVFVCTFDGKDVRQEWLRVVATMIIADAMELSDYSIVIKSGEDDYGMITQTAGVMDTDGAVLPNGYISGVDPDMDVSEASEIAMFIIEAFMATDGE